MIARLWKGAVRTEDANAYAAYMGETGLSDYASTPGNLSTWMLRRDCGDGQTEFLMLTFWESVAALEAFAGDDYEQGVFYPDDDRFLVARELRATHYDVTSAQPRATPQQMNKRRST